MPVTRTQGYQGLDVAVIDEGSGRAVTIAFDAQRDRMVPWGDGGVSWTLTGSSKSVRVEHSLTRDGDHWCATPGSPFTDDTQGGEGWRIERLRFTIESGTAEIVVSSPRAFSVEIA